MAAAGIPAQWWRLSALLPLGARSGLAALLSRLADRLSWGRDRRARRKNQLLEKKLDMLNLVLEETP